MLEAAKQTVSESIAVKEQFLAGGLEKVVDAAEAIARQLTSGGKLLAFGNGGSAADAQHLVAEFVNRFQLERPPLPAVALSTDTSVLTSIANDYSYDEVFAKQVTALGAAGDVALGISTSGGSPNVLAALRAARERGMLCIGLSGGSGGAMAGLCDIFICAPSDDTPRIQEVHGLVVHIICQLVDLRLFGRSK